MPVDIPDAPPAFAELDPHSHTTSHIPTTYDDAPEEQDSRPSSRRFSFRDSPPISQQYTAPPRLQAAPATAASYVLANKRLTQPLVSVEAVLAHLRLLRSFRQLKVDLLENKQEELSSAGLSDGDRWSIFLSKAYLRFTSWLTARTTEPEAYDFPVTDFLFIWYAYLVHPREHHEDNAQESVSKGFDVLQAAGEIDPTTDRHYPISSDDCRRFYCRSYTGFNVDISFSLLPDTSMSDEDSSFDNLFPVVCPKCQLIEYVPFLSLKGDRRRGYAHKEFQVQCRQCGLMITRETLSVARFAMALLVYVKHNIYLSGTQTHPTTGLPDGFFTATLNNGLTTGLRRKIQGADTVGEIGDRLDWSLQEVERLLRATELGSMLHQRVAEVMRCYSQPQFSVDLVDAAIRQSLYIDQLYELGWLDVERFEEDPMQLEYAIARYHQYLDMLAANQDARHTFPPTIDINLIMQTHQLAAKDYRNTCISVLGMVPNNNVVLSQKDLIVAHEKTAKLFRARFKQPYSTCSCDNTSAIRGKLSSALSLPSKDATRLEDVLNVLASSSARSFRRSPLEPMSNETTHPCAHNMSLDGLRKQGKHKSKQTSSSSQHRNDLLDPSPEWQAWLGLKSLYGYPSSDSQEAG